MGWVLPFIVLLACMTVFQISLLLGAPLGRFTWGGQNTGVLPARLRVAAALSVLIYAAMAVLALDRVGAVEWVPDAASTVGMWVVFVLLAFSAVPNAISRSKGERYVMTPVSVALAALALAVALT